MTWKTNEWVFLFHKVGWVAINTWGHRLTPWGKWVLNATRSDRSYIHTVIRILEAKIQSWKLGNEGLEISETNWAKNVNHLRNVEIAHHRSDLRLPSINFRYLPTLTAVSLSPGFRILFPVGFVTNKSRNSERISSYATQL